MNKTIKKLNITMIIGILAVWVSGSLFHFVYDWTGKNTFIGMFFPINESTWEHMKPVSYTHLDVYKRQRYDRLAPQFLAEHKYDLAVIQHGLQRMAWGLFKKFIIADRAGVEMCIRDRLFWKDRRYQTYI